MVRWLTWLLMISMLPNVGPLDERNNTRIALVEASWGRSPFSDRVLHQLRSLISEEEGIALRDPAIVQSAIRGFGYDGSLNLTVEQAHRLGAAIGCDYYILGRGRIDAVSVASDERIYRAWVALFFVNARNGELALFTFAVEERTHQHEAARALMVTLGQKMSRALRQIAHRPLAVRRPHAEPARVIDIDDPDALPPHVTPPRILLSPKPAYTRWAHIADVTATVELRVTFLPDGRLGPIDVVRWAGFGLDESARQAARRIRFRPATLDGRPVAARAIVRYEFRLIPSPSMSKIKAQTASG